MLTAAVAGVVQMTPEGEVRWTTSSLYDGEERWRSEGIQIGGIKSARGVIGNWFDKYDIMFPLSRLFWILTTFLAGITILMGLADLRRFGRSRTWRLRGRGAVTAVSKGHSRTCYLFVCLSWNCEA